MHFLEKRNIVTYFREKEREGKDENSYYHMPYAATRKDIESDSLHKYECVHLQKLKSNRRGPKTKGIIVIILLLIITPLLRGYRVAGSFQCNKDVNLA